MEISEYIREGKLSILVRPGSQKNEVVGWDDERCCLRVNIKARAEDNKANIDVVKFLSKLLKRKARILSGHTSKHKLIVFSD